MSTLGDQRRRLIRHHLPIGLASAVALAAFMTLPVFDAAGGRSADLTSGPLPQARDRSETAHEQAQPMPSASPGGGHGGGASMGPDSSGHPGPSATSGPHATGEPPPGAAQPQRDSTMGMSDDRLFIQRFTVATGYVATGLLAVTLLVGPLNMLFRRRNPVSNYLRRDVGAWTAGVSIIHVAAGLQVHGTLSQFANYFIDRDGGLLVNSFGLGNWTGLAATVLVVGLLAISSDVALRKLTARPWKRLQRLNYALFVLVLAHAFFYGALLRVTSPFTVVLLLSLTAVFLGQAAGIWLWRRPRRRATAAP